MNNCVLIGRLTKDVLVQYKDSGTAFAQFNIAIDRGKDKNGESRGADFPSCVAFGKTAELISKYCAKGLQIAIVAHVHTGNYQDKETGKTVYTTSFVVDRVKFIDWRKNDGQNTSQDVPDGIPEGFQAMTDEEIPF